MCLGIICLKAVFPFCNAVWCPEKEGAGDEDGRHCHEDGHRCDCDRPEGGLGRSSLVSRTVVVAVMTVLMAITTVLVATKCRERRCRYRLFVFECSLAPCVFLFLYSSTCRSYSRDSREVQLYQFVGENTGKQDEWKRGRKEDSDHGALCHKNRW